MIAVCEFSGIKEIITKPLFTIYHNPANREIFISNENGVDLNTVIIYNQIGQKVIQKTEINDKINVSMLR